MNVGVEKSLGERGGMSEDRGESHTNEQTGASTNSPTRRKEVPSHWRCYNCGGHGHIASTCPTDRRNQQAPKPTFDQSQNMGREVKSESLSTSNNEGESTEKIWAEMIVLSKKVEKIQELINDLRSEVRQKSNIGGVAKNRTFRFRNGFRCHNCGDLYHFFRNCPLLMRGRSDRKVREERRKMIEMWAESWENSCPNEGEREREQTDRRTDRWADRRTGREREQTDRENKQTDRQTDGQTGGQTDGQTADEQMKPLHHGSHTSVKYTWIEE